MKRVVSEFLDLLDLEQLEVNLFRGQNRDLGGRSVFGGQVLGQALNAASRTVEADRHPHSLHAYFILPGDMRVPIIYDVERIRDGRSFTTRRIVAVQHGRRIFNMSVSFHISEEGPDHRAEMPDVPGPEGLVSSNELRKKYIDQLPERMRRPLSEPWPIEFRTVERGNPLTPDPAPPRKHVWFRVVDHIGDAPLLHQCCLAYTSDFNLLSTALRPHGLSYLMPDVQLASLDHAMWFHRDFRADDWLLYALESPSAVSARGLAIGNVFTRSGLLVATVAQEGLIRRRKR